MATPAGLLRHRCAEVAAFELETALAPPDPAR